MFEKQEVMHNEGGYVPNRIFGLRFVARELNMRYDTYQNYLLVINLVITRCRSIEIETNI